MPRFKPVVGLITSIFVVTLIVFSHIFIQTSYTKAIPLPPDDDQHLDLEIDLEDQPAITNVSSFLISNSDCTVTPSKILGTRPLVNRIATVLSLTPEIYHSILRDWRDRHQFEDLVKYFARPQGFEILLLFDRNSYPGYGTNYLRVLDAVDLVPADAETRKAVAADRERVASKRPWDDPIDVVALNFTFNGVVVRIAHFRIPFHEAPGLSVTPNDATRMLDVSYTGERFPDHCKSPPWYVQGTKSYTTPEFWKHPLVAQSDYITKLDLDIWFFGHIPFRIVEDMELRGSLIGHSGAQNINQDPNGKCEIDKTCDFGFQEWMFPTLKKLNIAPCAAENPQFKEGGDLFYSNFIVFKTELFRHPQVLQFIEEVGRTPLWWKYRWGDQVFFHHALGILTKFLESYVTDYTEFRCFGKSYWDWITNPTELEAKCGHRSFTHKDRVPDNFVGRSKSPEGQEVLKAPYPLKQPLCGII